MRLSIIKLLFKMVGTEVLFKEAMRLVRKEVEGVKEEIGLKLGKYALKGVLWLIIGILTLTGFLFGLLGLAFYLNELFNSSCKGFLVIGGSFIVIVLLLLIIVNLQFFQHKD